MLETKIKGALMALLDGIKRADGGVIAAEMATLDECLAEGRGRLHPQLVHFLQQRSYAKAVMFLEGEGNIPAGICGGGRGGR